MSSRLLPTCVLWTACLLGATATLRATRAVPEKPPMGWNSFDSYGVYLTEEAARANLEAMAVQLKPFGYEYFVIDNGWAGEYELIPGTRFSREKHATKLHLDRHGYFEPSQVYFPHGFGPLIARCHELGLKFGVHLMRGIPRQAVAANLPIEGTSYHAADIADLDPNHQCQWCLYNNAVDMAKPGAQAWYDGLIRHLTDQGVDFIKYDDIVPYPREVEAVARAIAKIDRPIIFSLSPGGKVDPSALPAFQEANALRVTNDIWDDQIGIDRSFAAWKKWAGHARAGFWIDMDMIPFGELQIMTPARGAANGSAQALAGKGAHRRSEFTPDQMRTFITLRALAASPLMIGGDLVSLDDFSRSLITNPEIIACNQNGDGGHLLEEKNGVEIWRSENKAHPGSRWIGLFNRSPAAKSISFTATELQVPVQAKIVDVWNDRKEWPAAPSYSTSIPAEGVSFLYIR